MYILIPFVPLLTAVLEIPSALAASSPIRMIEEDDVNLNWELVFNIGTAALALLLLFWLDGAGLKGL